MKLHIGCGKRFIPGWYHVDGADFPHVNSTDYTLRYEDNNSIDIIYASHFLEYFDREEAFHLLGIWRHRIKPGGVIRLAVPDFEGLFEARLKGYGLDTLLGPLYGYMKMGDQEIYHKTIYDFNSIKKLLESVGFKDVRRYDWRQTEHADIDDHSRAHLPHDPEAIRTGNFTSKHILISLNVEATK